VGCWRGNRIISNDIPREDLIKIKGQFEQNLGFNKDGGENHSDTGSLNGSYDELFLLLRSLCYPKDSAPLIINEFEQLFSEIDFIALKEKFSSIKESKDIDKLAIYLRKLALLIEKEGYVNTKQPRKLIKLLGSKLEAKDIFEVIDRKNIPLEDKARFQRVHVGCAVMSQFAYILLKFLKIIAKGAVAPGHVFNLAFPNNDNTAKEAIFIDFTKFMVKKIDISFYYLFKGEYLVLKPEHQLSSKKIAMIQDDYQTSLGIGIIPDLTEKEALNLFYSYFRYSKGKLRR
jgi:hypothetical protein